ncbi:hypothetical protein LOC51_13300 [Rubrivivax sp. JA1024]|nr:hypothetical protein [Rubrivivax sp. JA1024]
MAGFFAPGRRGALTCRRRQEHAKVATALQGLAALHVRDQPSRVKSRSGLNEA